MEKIIGIYQILNIVNNKSYIGSSINCVNRLKIHKSLLKHKKHNNHYLQNSYNKYKIDNFIFKILEICNENELLAKEQYYVDLLGAYNITKEVIRNIPSKESKLKHSQTKKRMHKLGLLSKTENPIIQYDLIGNKIKEWNSITEASKTLNIHPTTIIRVLNGTYKQGKGYIWRYLENIEKPIVYFTRKQIWKNTRSKKVILTSENEILEFDSIKLAAAYFNITRQNFIQYIIKNLKFKRKYTIDLVKQEELLENPTLEKQKDNQQPSLDSNIFEGSTTNTQILSDN